MHDVMDCQVEILQLIKPYPPFAIIKLLLVFFTLKYPLSASVHVYSIILCALCMGVNSNLWPSFCLLSVNYSVCFR